MKRTRILFIVESGSDVRLVEGLAERFDLSIFARRIVGGVEISQTSSSDAKVVVGPSSRASFARAAFREMRAERDSFDFVIVQGYGAAALAANLAGRLFRIPVSMLVCSPVELYYLCRRAGDYASKPFRRRELLALSALARANARLGQSYFVLSEHLAEVVRSHGARQGKIETIPVYGVDTKLFAPAASDEESKRDLRERLGLPAKGAIVFFSSRVAPEKDAETLLAAARLLSERGREFWLLHRSGGHAEFVRAAERQGIAARVLASDAADPRSELVHLYRASDVCVQASREEGLGFSPLEALASGTPVVATAVGGLRETIVDGVTGWTYQQGDAEALSRAIEEALNDSEEAARRVARGREMVRERFESARVFDDLARSIETRIKRRSHQSIAKESSTYELP